MALTGFWECRKDIDATTNTTQVVAPITTQFFSVEDAKTYFEAELVLLRERKAKAANTLKTRDNLLTNATFDGLDVKPQWEKAKVVDKKSASFVEVPFTFDGEEQFGASVLNNKANPQDRSAARLVVSKNKKGQKALSFMNVVAEPSFTNGGNSLKSFSYESVPNGFKGGELHFDIDGKFNNGWHFSNGKIDGKILKDSVQHNEGGLRGRDSWQYYCYEVERYSVRVGNWKTTYVTVDCSYRLVMDWMNNISEYDGTGNNWGGSTCNGCPTEPVDDWGDAGCDFNCQKAKLDEQIKSLLTHPCLDGVLQELLGRSNPALTLAAFNNSKIPNINLTFKEGALDGAGVFGKTTGHGRDYTITLDFDKLSNTTDLFIATTIIHESIHAYLNMYLTVVHPEWADQTFFNQNVPTEAYAFYDLLKAYLLGQNNGIPDHSQMAASYRGMIKDALMDFMGSSNSKLAEICADLAWTGLDRSNLSEEDKKRISERISAEITNKSIGNHAPQGKNPCK